MEQDYYNILGVLRSADSADIAAAYRALARRFHPDVTPSTPETLARLKLVNEAYGILSDRQKRSEYDRRHRLERSTPHGGESRFAYSQTSDLEVDVPISPEEALHGGPCELTLTTWLDCGDCSGAGRTVDAPCVPCDGRGKIRRQRCLTIELPPGLRTGAVVRLASTGAGALWGRGDLFLRISVRPWW